MFSGCKNWALLETVSSQNTEKLLGGSHQGCAGDFSHGNVVQLPREEVIINDKRVVALIDSACSRSIVSSSIVSYLGLKPAMNHVGRYNERR